MKAPASSSPFRKFLRGLTNTGLLLLLPVQLMLAWVADLDQPTRMPDFLTERITAQLAEQGVRLQARRFWMLPDLTLAADDVSVSAAGLTGEVFVAARAEGFRSLGIEREEEYAEIVAARLSQLSLFSEAS
jgi:hypothetical protein